MPFVEWLGPELGWVDKPHVQLEQLRRPPVTGTLARVGRVLGSMFAGGTRFVVRDTFAWVGAAEDQDPAAGWAPRAHDVVLAGTITDLASIPVPLWGVIATYGGHTMPALLHDTQCTDAKQQTDPAARRQARREADRLFLTALTEHARTGPFTRIGMWAAVRLGGLTRPALFLAALATVAVAAAVVAPFGGLEATLSGISAVLGWFASLLSFIPIVAGLLAVAASQVETAADSVVAADRATQVCIALAVAASLPVVGAVFPILDEGGAGRRQRLPAVASATTAAAVGGIAVPVVAPSFLVVLVTRLGFMLLDLLLAIVLWLPAAAVQRLSPLLVRFAWFAESPVPTWANGAAGDVSPYLERVRESLGGEGIVPGDDADTGPRICHPNTGGGPASCHEAAHARAPVSAVVPLDGGAADRLLLAAGATRHVSPADEAGDVEAGVGFDWGLGVAVMNYTGTTLQLPDLEGGLEASLVVDGEPIPEPLDTTASWDGAVDDGMLGDGAVAELTLRIAPDPLDVPAARLVVELAWCAVGASGAEPVIVTTVSVGVPPEWRTGL